MPDIASMIMIGNAAIKIGTTAWKAYCEINEPVVEKFSAKRIDKILNNYKSTDQQLLENGLIPESFK